MTDLPENPAEPIGIEFIEFASTVPGLLEPIFEGLGFTRVALHRSKNMVLYRQSDVNFVVNNDPDSVASHFAAEHGPSACGLALRMRDAQVAYARALELGAFPTQIGTVPVELRLPALQGIGGAPLYLIDRTENRNAIYEDNFKFFPDVDCNPAGHGLKRIDHLTHHVIGGCLSYWAGLYESLFNTRKMRYSDMTEKRPTRLCMGVRPWISESLLQVNGEGIQHIALLTENLNETIGKLRTARVAHLSISREASGDNFAAQQQLPDEILPDVITRSVLLDGTEFDGRPRLLLQIRSASRLGPMLFELIEHKDGECAGSLSAVAGCFERDRYGNGLQSPAYASERARARPAK